jgi:hypothetical protein
MRAFVVVVVAACGGGSSPPDLPACTPEEQEVAGTSLVIDEVFLDGGGGGPCAVQLIRSSAELAAAVQNPPPELTAVDFAVDRVVLGATNPTIRFVVDSGTDLVVGEEPLCQGIAPQCVAVIVRATLRDALRVADCPYRGPDPCNAP